MMKSNRVSMGSYPVDEEGDLAKLSFKHKSLIQDFDDLQRETVSMKKNLQRAKLKKSNLLAEVRFLRRRFKYLMKAQSQKKQNQSGNLTQHKKPENRHESMMQERIYREKEAAMPSPSAVLDLNQISESKEEGTEEFQVFWEPLRMEKKLKKGLIVGGEQPLTNDLKLSICRDGGANRGGKRKISWQDQVVLRV